MNVSSGYSTLHNLIDGDQFVIQQQLDSIDIPEHEFRTLVRLPLGGNRIAEGGLRTKGLFKKSQEGKPLVSIVTVVFNAVEYLEETILSVLTQSYDNVEYIIIDGGSTDGTLKILEKYDHAIDYWISEEDSGMYDAINKGLRATFGEIINFINSDDLFTNKNIIEKVVDTFKVKGCDCLYGGSTYINEYGQKLFHKKPLAFKARYFKTLGLPFTQPTFFWTQELMKKVGLMNLKYKIVSDYDFISRLCLNANKVIRVKQNIACFRKHGHSFGDNNTDKAQKEFDEINNSLPINVSKLVHFLDRLNQKLNQILSSKYV